MLVDDECPFDLSQLPDDVQQLVRTHETLRNFSDYNADGKAADKVAKHLWDLIQVLPEEKQLTAIGMLNGAGFKDLGWLNTNKHSLAQFMAHKFKQLEKGDRGHGRLALAVARLVALLCVVKW